MLHNSLYCWNLSLFGSMPTLRTRRTTNAVGHRGTCACYTTPFLAGILVCSVQCPPFTQDGQRMLWATEVFVPVTHQTAMFGENSDPGNSAVNQLLGWQFCSESIIRLAVL